MTGIASWATETRPDVAAAALKARADERNRVLSIIDLRLVPLMYGACPTKAAIYDALREVRRAVQPRNP